MSSSVDTEVEAVATMSRWLKSAPQLDEYYPEDRSRPCYGFYAPAVDRIIFVDSRDLYLSLQSAILFSSKLMLLVLPFDSASYPIDNSTCYFWTPHFRIPQSAYHLPQIFPLVDGAKRLVRRGPSPHTSQQEIIRAQEHLAFVVQASHALYLTEAVHNINDATAYYKFFPEFQPAETADRRSFRRIEDILYSFDSIEEAMKQIDEILSVELIRPARQRYYARFNSLLYGRPKPPLK
jgi:hypothetical protein